MKIAIGSDELGIQYKTLIMDVFGKKGHTFVDVGAFAGETVNYPGIAVQAVENV